MKLLIEFFDKKGNNLERIVAAHIDASTNITVISRAVNHKGNSVLSEEIRIPEKIEHFNLFEGLITLYYQSGYYLEISKFRPGLNG
jgi:hypothetical protein